MKIPQLGCPSKANQYCWTLPYLQINPQANCCCFKLLRFETLCYTATDNLYTVSLTSLSDGSVTGDQKLALCNELTFAISVTLEVTLVNPPYPPKSRLSVDKHQSHFSRDFKNPFLYHGVDEENLGLFCTYMFSSTFFPRMPRALPTSG